MSRSPRTAPHAQSSKRAEPAARARPRPAAPAHDAVGAARSGGRPLPPTTRDRIEASSRRLHAPEPDPDAPETEQPAAQVAKPARAPAPQHGVPARAAEPPPTVAGARPADAPAPTMRSRIAARALAAATVGPAPAADAPEPARAEPSEALAGGAHASRPGEAAAVPVEPEPRVDQLVSDVDAAAWMAAGPGSARRRRGVRAAAPGGERGRSRVRPGGGSGQQHARPLVRIEASKGGRSDAGAPVARIEPHARGPPAVAAVEPTSISAQRALPRTWSRREHAECSRAAAGAPPIQAKLAVSRAGDACEREADAVAARVLCGASPHLPVTASPPSARPRASPNQRGPPCFPAAGLPGTVQAALQCGGGRPLDHAVRARIEPYVGLDLGHVRVRCEPDAAAAARDIGARAFTAGATIYLAAGASPADVGLIAHEAAHVAQQASSAGARATLQRLGVSDFVPDWILDGVRSAVRAIPGYSILTTIVGQDLLTGRPATTSREELVETLLTYGPFGAAVGPLLSAIDVLGDVFAVISEGLAANDLTLARIARDIDAAWEEFSVTNGIAGNVAIVRRLVEALLRDVARFVSSIVDRVIELVRSVVAEVAEPLLQTPAIKPVWDLTKKVLRHDPLRGEPVEAETVEIIADFLRLIGEEERLEQMQERGTLQETADWLDTQLAAFRDLVGELGTLFSDAWAAISPQNLPDLPANLAALAERAFGLIGRVGEFAATLIVEILALVKQSLLDWLSEHAHDVPGYELLTVILGQDPFTGEAVERTARNLIRGFITLMPGGAATFDQLAEAGVIDQAAERIESEMSRLGISLELITGIFVGIWDTLTLDDLLDPIGAFDRILALFGEPLARLVEFVGVVIEVVVTLVLALMNFPSDLLGRVIAGAVQAIDDIQRDPVAFLLNMLEAVKLGFSSFFGDIVGHLTQGLVSWLFRGLGQLGIRLPVDFSLGSVLDLVFQVLGLTVEYLWTKLGQHIGPERVAMIRGALDRLSGAWEFIVDVQREGLAAIWRFVSDQLSGLWDTLLTMAKDWIMTRIVSAVTTRLLSLLDPTGVMAVVNSFIAFFDAIQSAIEYFRDILEIVAGYVETLAAVAAGNVAPGAQMLEQGLANAIPIAIGFLAQQVGLGNIPEKIVEIIGRLRELVDRAIDWLIEQALRLGRAALDALGLGQERAPPETAPEEGGGELTVTRPLTMASSGHVLTLRVVDGRPQILMASARQQFLETATVSAIYREQQGANRPAVLGALNQIADKLKDLGEDWAAAYSKSDAEKRVEISLWLSTLADVLQGLGREFDIPSLEHLGHASKYVEGNQIKPEWSGRIRDVFYPSGYRTNTESWFGGRLVALGNPADPAQFRDEMTSGWEPKTTATIDHIHKVVDHWNDEGNGLRQVPRADYYNDTSNMRVVAHRNNSSDGAMARRAGLRYQPTVGTDFRGPDDNP